MTAFFQTLNSYLWGFPMIAFLLFTHIFFTAKTGVIQKKLIKGIRLSVTNTECNCSDISPFQTLCTTLASTLGTGNIIGVGTAIALGGAGALFWCVITGIFGMATMYCETLLSVIHRKKNSDGEYSGGPMYYMEKGLNARGMAVFYSLAAAGGGLVTGAVLQANAISTAVYGFANIESSTSAVHISPVNIGIGIVAAVLAALVILGGVKSIGSVCQVLVPFMAAAYMLGCIGIMVINREHFVDAVKLVLTSAFVPRAAMGGFAGSTIMTACRFGMARGLFSNEAGAGTTSVVGAATRGKNPHELALVSMTAAFWDTAVVCTMTGLAIISAMLANPEAAQSTGGDMLANLAFSTLPIVGRPVLFFGLITFAFSTIIGWSYIGSKCVEYIFGIRGIKVYKWLWIGVIGVSAIFNSEFVWSLADTVNVLLVLPNTVALYLLAPKTIKAEAEKSASA